MIHLITVAGKNARSFHLKEQQISDFKALIRTITSGRILIVSTWFRSDLFYQADKEENTAILKAWELHANAAVSDLEEVYFQYEGGDESALSNYFLSINRLATNWHRYKLYKKAFHYSFSNDPRNPMARTVAECDHHLTLHPDINRKPLIDSIEGFSRGMTKDTFSLAMRIINNQTHTN